MMVAEVECLFTQPLQYHSVPLRELYVMEEIVKANFEDLSQIILELSYLYTYSNTGIKRNTVF